MTERMTVQFIDLMPVRLFRVRQKNEQKSQSMLERKKYLN